MDERQSKSDNDQQTAPTEEFVQLFSRSQRRLYLYILAQIPSPIEAEEILQETNVVIWRKFSQFQTGTNFLAWACQIANLEVLKYRDRRRRDKHYFSEDLIQQIADDALDAGEAMEERRKALVYCLGKLRQEDRELIRQRYAPGESGISVAAYLGRPVNSVYQSLGRIRRTLLECITRQMASESL